MLPWEIVWRHYLVGVIDSGTPFIWPHIVRDLKTLVYYQSMDTS